MYALNGAQAGQGPVHLVGRERHLAADFHGCSAVIYAQHGQIHIEFKTIGQRTQNSAWRGR